MLLGYYSHLKYLLGDFLKVCLYVYVQVCAHVCVCAHMKVRGQQ